MMQLLSQDDWNSLQEILYFQSIPGFVQSIRAAEQSDDWVSEEEFLRTLEEYGRFNSLLALGEISIDIFSVKNSRKNNFIIYNFNPNPIIP